MTNLQFPLTTEKKPNNPHVNNMQDLTDNELVDLRIALDLEMRHRGIDFSVGNLGEKLVIDFFNTTPGLPTLAEAPTGTKNIDAISRDGERYSIKTLLRAKKTGTIYPDEADKNRQLFEHLLLVKLTSEYRLSAIYRFSWLDFVKIRSWDKRMNAWYISAGRKNLNLAQKLFPFSD